MNQCLVYGVVINNKFYSDNMEIKLSNTISNGFYHIDVASDEYTDSIAPCDLMEFKNYFKKRKKTMFIHGIVLGNKVLPFNPLKYKNFKIPLEVSELYADDWDIVVIFAIPHKNVYIYFDSPVNGLSQLIYTVKESFESGINNISSMKEITPEMKIAFQFHLLEKLKQIEIQKQIEIEQFKQTIEGRIQTIIETSGGRLVSFRELNNIGYEVTWEAAGYKINSVLNKNFGVIEAGFCVSNYDTEHTLTSVVRILQDYIDDGEYIHITRRIS